MRTEPNSDHFPPQAQPHGEPDPRWEPVDLDDPAAVKRAIALHQAGKAVFAIPFNDQGAGSLTWLDPRARQEADRAA